MKNITSLRNHLFEALNRLADATEYDIELEIKKSVHIVNVSDAIIKSAEVENEFVRLTQGKGSGFIPVDSSGLNLENIKIEDNELRQKKLFNVDENKNWLVEELHENSNHKKDQSVETDL